MLKKIIIGLASSAMLTIGSIYIKDYVYHNVIVPKAKDTIHQTVAPVESTIANLISDDDNYQVARVLKVIDGDTFKAKVNGKVETIRLIGVDTPETVHPNKPVQKGGREASNFTKITLRKRKVYLQKDIRDRDKYGRLLRYVWLEKPDAKNYKTKMLNAVLIRKKLGKPLLIPPNLKYAPLFASLDK